MMNIYDNIYRGKTSEIIDLAINKLIKNSDIAAVASSLADATGLSDVTAGYIKMCIRDRCMKRRVHS